jgi:hypothetical protein
VVAVYSLRQSSAQAEDALSQGMEKLQQTLSESLLATADPFAIPDAYNMGTSSAVVKLKGLVGFVQQVTQSITGSDLGATHRYIDPWTEHFVLGDAGRPSSAGDAAEHAQDPHDAAGGEGPPRAGRLLPAPPRAQLALGGAPARVGHKLKRCNAGIQMLQKLVVIRQLCSSQAMMMMGQ